MAPTGTPHCSCGILAFHSLHRQADPKHSEACRACRTRATAGTGATNLDAVKSLKAKIRKLSGTQSALDKTDAEKEVIAQHAKELAKLNPMERPAEQQLAGTEWTCVFSNATGTVAFQLLKTKPKK